MRNEIYVDCDPCDEPHKGHKYNLGAPATKASCTIHTMKTFKGNDLFDLPEIVKWHATIGGFNIALKDDKGFTSMLTSE